MRSTKSVQWRLGSGLWVLVVCWLLLPLALPAQQAQQATEATAEQGVEDLSYTLKDTGEAISYALYVPSTYDASDESPLIVLLHGLGSNPDQVIHYAGILSEAEKRGYIVVAPFGYNSHGWYGSLGQGKEFMERFRRNGAAPSTDPDNLGELSEKDVFNVLDLITKEYSIDPDRTYLMGHSMGGGGTLYLAMKHPDLWAAIAAMAPAIYSDPKGLESAVQLPAIVVQGDADRLVQVGNTRKWIDEMKELGMTYRYIEIAGGDHIASISRNPEMIGEVFDFFDQHKRAAVN